MLVGDSQLRGIRRNVFNNSFDKLKRYIKPFGGAKKDMKHYIISSLTEQKLDIAAIHTREENDINYKNIGNV